MHGNLQKQLFENPRMFWRIDIPSSHDHSNNIFQRWHMALGHPEKVVWRQKNQEYWHPLCLSTFQELGKLRSGKNQTNDKCHHYKICPHEWNISLSNIGNEAWTQQDHVHWYPKNDQWLDEWPMPTDWLSVLSNKASKHRFVHCWMQRMQIHW